MKQTDFEFGKKKRVDRDGFTVLYEKDFTK